MDVDVKWDRWALWVVVLLISTVTVYAQDGDEIPGADAAGAGNRIITLVPSVKGANLFPLKNPGVVTLGTLSILNRIDFAISAYTTLSTNSNAAGGALTYAWDWGLVFTHIFRANLPIPA